MQVSHIRLGFKIFSGFTRLIRSCMIVKIEKENIPQYQRLLLNNQLHSIFSSKLLSSFIKNPPQIRKRLYKLLSLVTKLNSSVSVFIVVLKYPVLFKLVLKKVGDSHKIEPDYTYSKINYSYIVKNNKDPFFTTYGSYVAKLLFYVQRHPRLSSKAQNL